MKLSASSLPLRVFVLLLILAASAGSISAQEGSGATSSAPSPLVGASHTRPNDDLGVELKTSPLGKAAPKLQALGSVPLSFEANRGPAEKQVQFAARTGAYTLYLTGREAVVEFPQNRSLWPLGPKPSIPNGGPQHTSPEAKPRVALRMRLVGSNIRAKALGLDELSGKSNYFIGSNPAKWRTGVPNYAKVKYEGVYPGVDLVYYGNQGQLEYDFEVAPGADPHKIALEVAVDSSSSGHLDVGQSPLRIASNGDVILKTGDGEVHLQKPAIYQVGAGPSATSEQPTPDSEPSLERHSVDGRFVLKGRDRIGFEIASYDRAKPLVIDPAIVYSTYLNTSVSQNNPVSSASSVAEFTDPQTGHVYVYVAGSTCATGFPVVNAIQGTFGGGCDAFVTKIDPAASGNASVIWSTYLGGNAADGATGVAVDSVGNAVIVGNTQSTDLPTVSAYQSSPKGMFLTKLSSDGSTLLYSTYFGGSAPNGEYASAVALDSAGHAYIVGETSSGDLPTLNPYQPTLTSQGAAFLAIFDSAQSGQASLLYSTYFGSAGEPLGVSAPRVLANAVAVDASRSVHFGGTIVAIPIVNGFQITPLGQSAGFYAKLNPWTIGPSQLLYSTYIGGSSDSVTGIALDSFGDAYLAGNNYSAFFSTTPNSGQTIPTYNNTATTFIAKINPSQSGSASLVYSTILPGLGVGPESAIAVDASGDAFVAGSVLTGLPLIAAVRNSSTGVFQSADLGMSWTGLTQGLTEFPIASLAIDTSTTPRTLYAGTGAPPGSGGDGGLLGGLAGGQGNATGSIFASADGGLNWNRVFQLVQPSPGAPGCSGSFPGSCVAVTALVVDPNTPSNIYAGTSDGVFLSSDRGATWNAFNSGLSDTAIQGEYGVQALVFDGDVLYAGAADGLYVLGSGASTWVNIGPVGICGSGVSPVFSIAIDSTTTPHTIYTTGGGCNIFKSTDGGSTWTPLPGCGGGSDLVAVDTTSSPAAIYGFSENGQNICKSSDGGSTWTQLAPNNGPLFFDTNNSSFAVVGSQSPAIIYFANAGEGLFRSADGGATWQPLWSTANPTFISSALVVDPTTIGPTSHETIYIASESPTYSGFVAEIDPLGSTFLFSTYLNGIGGDGVVNSIALDSDNNIYVAGNTDSLFFPTVSAFQTASSVPLGPGNSGGYSGFPTSGFLAELGTRNLPQTSAGSVNTEVAVQTGTLTITLPDITGSTTNTQPTLTVTPLSPATTANFSLSDNLGAYEISTTATFSASGSVTLCFQALTVNDPTTFSNLSLLHIVNGVAQNITSSYSFASRTICGTTTSFSPFILVKGAVGQIRDLITVVNNLDLKKGIQTSLDAKLQNAVAGYDSATSHNYASVCSVMGAFMNAVQAQTGQFLTVAEAAPLLSAAKQVEATVGCP